MAGLIPFNRKAPTTLSTGFDDLYNVLDDFFSDSWWPSRNLTRDTFKIDVKENDGEYLIEAEVPGVKKDEIDLDLNEGKLTISIRREESVSDESKNYIHRERRLSSMSRSLSLPNANHDEIKAKLEHGVLAITVPKSEKARNSYKIDIE